MHDLCICCPFPLFYTYLLLKLSNKQNYMDILSTLADYYFFNPLTDCLNLTWNDKVWENDRPRPYLNLFPWYSKYQVPLMLQGSWNSLVSPISLGIRRFAMEGFGGVSEGGKCHLSWASLCSLGPEALLLLSELQAVSMASSCFLMVSRRSLS